eukprot:10914397-Lingulodinium_polyedra.AAC.1
MEVCFKERVVFCKWKGSKLHCSKCVCSLSASASFRRCFQNKRAATNTVLLTLGVRNIIQGAARRRARITVFLSVSGGS